MSNTPRAFLHGFSVLARAACGFSQWCGSWGVQQFAKPLTQASPALNSGSYVFKFRAVLFVVVIAAVNCFLLVFRLTLNKC